MSKIKESQKKIDKVIVSVGVGSKRHFNGFEDKVLPQITEEIGLMTGQKPAPRQARKSIAGFNVREGDIVSLQSTLRGNIMVDFIEKVVNIALPRVRDFRGLDLNKVDEGGNLNIGFKDRQVFPEVDVEDSQIDFGLQVTVVPKSKDRDEAIALYREMGFPLKEEEKAKEEKKK